MGFRVWGVIIAILLISGWNCASRPGLDTTPRRVMCYYDAQIDQYGKPSIYADFIQFFTEDKPRVDVYLEIPHANLYFARVEEDQLDTEYTVTIIFNDEKGNIVERKEFTRGVSTTRELIGRYAAADRTMESFRLVPGQYRVTITILNRAVGTRTEIREILEIISKPELPVIVSDLLLIRSIRTVETRRQRIITPMLSTRVLAITEPFHVFTELYSDNERNDVPVQYGIIKKYYNNDFLIESPFSYRVQRPYHRTGIFIEERDTIMFSDTTITLNKGANQIFLPIDLILDRGAYKLFVNVINDEKGENTSSVTDFTVHSLDFPAITDVDQQIEVLHYIATTRELERILAGETKEERRRTLYDYWQRVGAWKMSDFYERARVANELFTTNVEGWKTPMGMVLIVLGEPHFVTCQIGVERTETWSYYLQGGNMEFVFIRDRITQPDDHVAYYWISTVRGGYSAWYSALNTWR